MLNRAAIIQNIPESVDVAALRESLKANNVPEHVVSMLTDGDVYNVAVEMGLAHSDEDTSPRSSYFETRYDLPDSADVDQLRKQLVESSLPNSIIDMLSSEDVYNMAVQLKLIEP